MYASEIEKAPGQDFSSLPLVREFQADLDPNPFFIVLDGKVKARFFYFFMDNENKILELSVLQIWTI